MKVKNITAAVLCAFFIPLMAYAKPVEQAQLDNIIKPLMSRFQLPGMAIAVSMEGEDHFYNYGVASKESQQPVTRDTLFEIGSLSKTFTGTLATWAQGEGKLSLDDPASKFFPPLQGTAFDNISLLHLATHTSGLPLLEPEGVTTDEQLMVWYQQWQPVLPAGNQRIYSNMGVGLLGLATAKSLGQSFNDAMQQRMLPALGMSNTYLQVPKEKMDSYAQGYSRKDQPVRVSPGIVDAEAYGLKSSATDLIRFLNINMQAVPIDAKWQRAVNATHTGYYQVSQFVQDIMWESYPYPTPLSTLTNNNSPRIIFESHTARLLTPPQAPQQWAMYNKTGSTNGFSCYVLFVPAKKMAIVILANKSYPNIARVKAAYDILALVDPQLKPME